MGTRKLVTLVLIAVALAVAARYLFWNDRRDVRRRLVAIAEAASVRSSDTEVERTARAAQLGRFVTDDVIIRTDSSAFVGGRPAVVRFVLDGAATRGNMRMSLEDLQVELMDPSTATAFFTLRISGDDPQATDPVPRQVHATLSKVDGEWLISRGEVLRTLEPPK
jgi:ketosteroid isomerase-like protein